MPPLFSIVIPTFNRATLLSEALRSALSQTFTDYDVIVRDNASTDATMNVVQSCGNPRLRYLRNEQDVGAEGNFELLASDCAGDFLVLLQDDDLLHPDFLARAARAIEGHPDVFVYAAYSSYASPSIPQYWIINDGVLGPELPINWDQTGPRYWPGPLASVQCLVWTGFWFPVLALRRDLCLRYLPLDLSLGNAADRYLTARVATEGTVAVEAWIAGVSRRHAGQWTNRFGKFDRYLVLAAQKLIGFYESKSLDWQGLVREWMALLNKDRRWQWFSHATSLPYPQTLQETLADAVAHDTGQDVHSLLRSRPSWGEALKGAARDLTPPLIWRLARRVANKFFNDAAAEERS